MHFDLTDLRLFICIAESPSLTQGAHKAFLSPSAASIRIKALEKQLNSQLFYRNNSGVTLTDSGKRLLLHARLILQQAEYLKHEFNGYTDSTAGHVRILANTTAITEFLPEILSVYLAKHPAVTIDLREHVARDIYRGVLDGAADIGITAGPLQDNQLEAIHLSTDRLVLTIPTDHPLNQKTTVTLEESLLYPHIGLQDGSSLISFLRNQIKQSTKTLTLRIQVFGFESMCRMIETGVGIGIMPNSAAKRYSKTMQLQIIELDEPWAIRNRYILVRDKNTLPSCVQRLMTMMVDQFKYEQ